MQLKFKSKIVFGTNIWISFLIGKELNNLEDIIIENQLVILFSDELLTEINSVVSRPKFIKYFPTDSFLYIEKLFLIFEEKILVTSDIQICRDKKDNYLLELCVDGKANFLVTGDNDLLVLSKIKKTKIITFSDFQRMI